MPIELSSDRAVCYRCGTPYSKKKGYFSVCHGESYKGVGYMHICKSCVEKIYNLYLAQCNDPRLAVRQTCRKLDLYWSDAIYEPVIKKSTAKTVMVQYITKVNSITYAGKSYDDTLLSEGIFWSFSPSFDNKSESQNDSESKKEKEEDQIPQEIVDFWGGGYSNDVYRFLDQRYKYYLSKLTNGTNIDVGKEILLKQIPILEYDINRCVAEGKTTDKQTNALNNVLDGLHLKPKQNKQDELNDAFASTPMGVWIEKFEHHKPLPEAPEELKARHGTIKYVFTWLGHVLEMLGKKNPYKDLYDNEMERLRVEPPTYDGDDPQDEDADGDSS